MTLALHAKQQRLGSSRERGCFPLSTQLFGCVDSEANLDIDNKPDLFLNVHPKSKRICSCWVDDIESSSNSLVSTVVDGGV